MSLHTVTFTGGDDSVDPRLLHAISEQVKWVEWAVSFHPDKHGTPRFPSMKWVDELGKVNWQRRMRISGHLCGRYVSALLQGDDTFVYKLHQTLGMNRFQINAPLDNVDDRVAEHNLRKVMQAVPTAQFILQHNEHTSALWMELLKDPPSNLSILYDESMGQGRLTTSWPVPPSLGKSSVPVGYAGGLGPDNIAIQLQRIAAVVPGQDFWVDMETSLRTLQSATDIFDLSKVMQCVRIVMELGMVSELSRKYTVLRTNRTISTKYVAETLLPTSLGKFRMRAYRDCSTGEEPMVFIAGPVEGRGDVVVRVHDQCLTSEIFGSLKCDCKQQLDMALTQIRQDPLGGMVIYMPQEGRGIGLANKVAAYKMQEEGYDTVDANRVLGLPDDARKYDSVVDILDDLGITSVKLMTNNPMKIRSLEQLGIKITGRVPCMVPPDQSAPQSLAYQKAKWKRMDHMFDENFAPSKDATPESKL